MRPSPFVSRSNFTTPNVPALRGAFEFLVGLHAAHLRIELSRLVEFLDVELAREIVSVQFGDKHPPALIPAYRRGRRDERFAGDHLHAKTIRQLERRGALLGSHGLGCVGWLWNLREGDVYLESGGQPQRCTEQEAPKPEPISAQKELFRW